MNRTFDENLDKLRTRLIRMGSLVEEQVEFAIRALHEGNVQLAQIVIDRDDKVDKLDLKIDKQCQRIFALNQPVASDLRLLLAAIKINNELERIGDMAASVASTVIAHPSAPQLGLEISIDSLSKAVHKLISSSIDAFINNDPDLAAHILPTDARVNTLSSELQATLTSIMMERSETVSDGAQLLICIHTLGRMADHATNIAENVIFLVKAKLVRHRSVNEDAIDFSELLDQPDPDDSGGEDNPTEVGGPS